MIKVLIADDHAVVRKGLKQILANASLKISSGEASNGLEALEKIRKEDYNVVILDISMPGISGLETLKQLKKEKPGLHILILSVHSEEQYAMRSIKAGASGYLTKASAPEELIAAIQKVSQGEKYITLSLANKLALDIKKDFEKPLHETLSDREYQVLLLMASGKTVGEVAEELFLSAKTVSTYRNRIMEKMELKNNSELIRYALKNKLID